MNTSLKRHALLITALVIAAGAATARADSLAAIPTLAGDTVNEGRAITSDGQFIVGLSGSRGFLYSVGGASSTYVLSSDNAGATIANGVGYRTSGGNTELIISGMSSGYVTEWMTADGGATFGIKRRNTSYTYNTMPAANALGATTGSDAYYVSSVIASAGNPVGLNRGSGPWVATMTYSAKGITTPAASQMNGVSASGKAAGWRTTTAGVKQNYVLNWNGTATPANGYINGLLGTPVGEAFSISADGTAVFGQSPITGDTRNWGYKATIGGANGITETGITRLSYFGDETGSTSLQVPYGCTADGNFAVGMDYRGIEKAVLWSTKEDWSFVLDLTEYASANSLLDGFSRLNRAYSIGGNADGSGNLDLVITGTGSWSPDGGVTPYTTRAFVMTVMIPEPGTVSLLALGLFGLLVSRRRK